MMQKWRPLFVLSVLGLLLIVLMGCETTQRGGIDRRPEITVPGGDVEQGRQLLGSWGCGTCHNIPGVVGADALVGPPLNGWAKRQYIAGSLPNTPDNLIRWIMDPQGVEPGTAMPDMNIQEEIARHMSAYLYTLSEMNE